MKEKIDEQTAIQALQDWLQKIPFIQVVRSVKQNQQPGGPDFQADLRIGDRSIKLLVEVKSNGQPRLARQAVYALKNWLADRPDTYGIFIAPYISQEAAAICQEEGIGYLDLAGNCHLSFDTVYIHQQSYPNSLAQRRDHRSLYSPKAERILRVLLTDPQHSWKTETLANAAGVSLGQVANVKKLLTDREWLLSEATGIRLSAPRALLDEWSQQYKFRRNKVNDYYAMAEVSEIEYQLAEACQLKNINYALTGFSGAARLAPAVRYQRGMAYLDGGLGDLVDTLGWKSVESGANISLLAPYDEGVFYGTRDVNGVQVASPVQVYLDLQSYRGRGQEAAQAVRKEIEKAWL